MSQQQTKTICRTEKKCRKCQRTIKVGETHYRSGSNYFPQFICSDCRGPDLYEFVAGDCKQCGKCCRLTTYAGEYEFGKHKLIDAYLSLFGIDQEVYDKLFIYPELEPGTIVFHENIKCPNLTEDNLCGIYETRPKMCRDFPSTDKDAEFLTNSGLECKCLVVKEVQ